MKPDHTTHADTVAYPTLVDALAARAETEDVGMTVVGPTGDESPTSWAELWRRAKRRAAWLSDQGVGLADTVGIALPNDERFVEAIFAAWLVGALPVTLARPGVFEALSVSRVEHILADSGVGLLLVAEEEVDDFAGVRGEATVLGVGAPIEGPEIADPAPPDPDRPALLQYTSGSTSRPRGVILSHGNLASNSFDASIECDFTVDEAMASWVPFYHDMGLIAELLLAIMRGVSFYVMEPLTFLHDPSIWLETISRHGVTLTHSPNLGLAHCLSRATDDLVASLDLSALRSFGVGSEPIDAALVDAFHARFGPAGLPPDAIHGAYGLAEATVAVSHTVPAGSISFDHVDREELASGAATPAASPDAPGAMSIACVGTPIPNVAVQVVGEDDEPLPDRRVGELWVRGPGVMQGYWGKPEDTAAALVESPEGPWLRTGDLAYLVDGSIYICGRIKELIILRGKNYHPEDLERAAELVPGVRKGQSVAFSVPGKTGGEEVAMVCESKDPERDGLLQAIRGRVAAETGVKITHLTVQPPNSLPRTTSGKRQRRLVRRFFLSMRGGA